MVRAGCIAGRTPPGFCHRLLSQRPDPGGFLSLPRTGGERHAVPTASRRSMPARGSAFQAVPALRRSQRHPVSRPGLNVLWDVLLGCPPAPDFRNLIFETCRIGVWTTAGDLARPLVLHAPAESGAPPSRPAGGCGNPEISLSGNSEPSRAGLPAGGETRAAFGRRSIPAKQPVVKPTRRSAGDPSRPNSRWRNPRGVRPAIHPA